MAYRQDDRPRCESCESVLAVSEGVYAPDGRLVCRTCNSRTLVAQSDSELAADRVRTLRRKDRDAPRRERSPVWGSVLIAPSVLFGIGALLAVLEHSLSGGSCSELGCFGVALLALGGLIFGSLPALIGVVLLPARLRLRGAGVALGALIGCVVSLSYA
jgi:hypothetical protein